MSRLSFGFEKFERAALILSVFDEDPKKNLFDAGYQIAMLTENNIPEELRAEFNRLLRGIIQEAELLNEETLKTSIDRLSEDEARKYACHILVQRETKCLAQYKLRKI